MLPLSPLDQPLFLEAVRGQSSPQEFHTFTDLLLRSTFVEEYTYPPSVLTEASLNAAPVSLLLELHASAMLVGAAIKRAFVDPARAAAEDASTVVATLDSGSDVHLLTFEAAMLLFRRPPGGRLDS